MIGKISPLSRARSRALIICTSATSATTNQALRDRGLSRAGAGVNKGTVSKSKAAATAPSEAIPLRYPEGSHDAEALLVHPHTGNIYLVTKIAFANPEIYEAAAP